MKTNKTLITTFLLLAISIKAVSQNGVIPPPPQPPPPVGLPIDNGILVLLVLGVIYGVYKLMSSKKRLSA